MNRIVNFIQKILKSEILFLIFFLIKLWFLIGIINRHNPYSKLYYIFDTDKEFLDDINRYYNQSLIALEKIKKWKSENYQIAKLRNSDQPFFNNYELIRENGLKEGKLCVGIMSKQRPVTSHNYPLKTIVSLLSRVPLKYQDRILVTVYNVDRIPLKNRTDLVPLIGIVNIVDFKQNVSKLVDNFDGFKKIKEAADYVTVLRHYYNQDICDLILMIEDDSIPCKNWYNKIIEAVGYVKKTNWFCLKLFTSFREFDWAVYPYSVLIAIVKLIIINFILNIIFMPKMIKIVLFVNAILIVIRFNELSIRPIGYGVKEYSIGFNAIANLYPKSKLNELAEFIEDDVINYITHKASEFEPKDIALELFRKMHKYKEFFGWTFMLKLQENSDAWQIYYIRQPMKILLIFKKRFDLCVGIFIKNYKKIDLKISEINL
uniref:Uncharacterized protein n=1 Tax=Brachionus plicatilis TaxID=10195 RepID=A0A3M7SA69_BRAPC|nr:hypothetical protein BpHYR1_004478 [Brachionus plicatilis]